MTKKYRQKNKKGKNYRNRGDNGSIELKCTNGSKRVIPEQMMRRHFPKRRIREITIHSKINHLPYGKIYDSNVENIVFYTQYYDKTQISNDLHKTIYFTINSGDFENCNKLKKVTIPWGHLVKKEAFHNCKNLQEVVLKEGCIIEDGAFPSHTNVVYESV